ncbi:hypothetical protein LAZ67_4003453 [Cordylochernes scorpioides]|uniref:RNase H type-1 domain-containing protein n=1 Tax=Cordylochernes scorpioides TaxID=51811 RepID=A0ABY6KGP9_9ARAC|nr:hypothetical protein LAZ67_4003453 [Cordylochernes scorpioides]
MVRNLNYLNVQLYWVRGHSGIEGNEHADKLAKAAADSNSPISYSTLSKTFVRSRSEQYSLQLWKELNVTDHSTRNPRRIAAFPNTLMAILPKIKFCGTTSTILTGHGFVKADAAKLSRDDPTCPHCHEEDQTVDHLLFRCPAYHLHRFQTATLLGIKIFAPEDLIEQINLRTTKAELNEDLRTGFIKLRVCSPWYWDLPLTPLYAGTAPVSFNQQPGCDSHVVIKSLNPTEESREILRECDCEAYFEVFSTISSIVSLGSSTGALLIPSTWAIFSPGLCRMSK